MLAGELYNASDAELVGDRRRCRQLLARYNASDETDGGERSALLRDLLGAVGDGADIQPRFSCDYGYSIRIGHRAFINYNCVFLDCAVIEIGDDLQMGTNVQLYAATHPLASTVRARWSRIRPSDPYWKPCVDRRRRNCVAGVTSGAAA
jgi:maltose O-acetyltransferase